MLFRQISGGSAIHAALNRRELLKSGIAVCKHMTLKVESAGLCDASQAGLARHVFPATSYLARPTRRGRGIGPGIGRNAGATITQISGTVDRPGQILRFQLAAFGRNQTVAQERKTGPRAVQVDTVVRVEHDHAAISSLARV